MESLIPEAIAGKNTDLEVTFELNSLEAARACFATARERLLSPGKWKDLIGKRGAEFSVFRSGNPLYEQAEQGDFIRISIPGPGTSSGDGYDWVRVALIEYNADPAADEESIGMKVIADSAPGTNPGVADHFFEKGASSSFLIKRIANRLVSEYHGRNEIPNTKAEKITDKIRNVMVALGAIVGLSELQWKTLIKSFISEK